MFWIFRFSLLPGPTRASVGESENPEHLNTVPAPVRRARAHDAPLAQARDRLDAPGEGERLLQQPEHRVAHDDRVLVAGEVRRQGGLEALAVDGDVDAQAVHRDAIAQVVR